MPKWTSHFKNIFANRSKKGLSCTVARYNYKPQKIVTETE